MAIAAATAWSNVPTACSRIRTPRERHVGVRIVVGADARPRTADQTFDDGDEQARHADGQEQKAETRGKRRQHTPGISRQRRRNHRRKASTMKANGIRNQPDSPKSVICSNSLLNQTGTAPPSRSPRIETEHRHHDGDEHDGAKSDNRNGWPEVAGPRRRRQHQIQRERLSAALRPSRCSDRPLAANIVPFRDSGLTRRRLMGVHCAPVDWNTARLIGRPRLML